MSWAKENKFLAGFGAATLVGAGILSFLAFQAKGKYDETYANYEQQSAELNRLQTLQPYPNAENVKKLEEQRKKHAEAIKELQASLGKVEIPLENVTQLQFQDKLRTTVDAINQSANQNGVKRTDTFNLGFERYLSEPPRQEAAPALARQLRAVELVVAELIRNRVVELRDLKRDELPEEKGASAPAPAAPAKGGAPKAPAKGGKELVTSSSFEVTFFADQGSFVQILNAIVSSKEQFLVPRLVTVKNEKDLGPARNDPANPVYEAPPVPPPGETTPGAPAADPNAAPGAPGAPGAPAPAGAPAKKILVGEERVEVTMRIEILDFAEAPAANSKS